LQREGDVVSNLASELDCELRRAGVGDRVPNLPTEMEVFRNDHAETLTAMATALGEEFEQIHVNHLSEMASALGEEFDKVHAEWSQPMEGCVIELQQNQARLVTLMQGMLERQDLDTACLDELKLGSVSGATGLRVGSQASPASEADALRLSENRSPFSKQTINAPSDMQPGNERSWQSLDQSGEGATSLALHKVQGRVDVEALREEQNAKLAAMAEALGEEFEHMHSVHLTDMACALGEEFEKLHGERHQLLQDSLVELQQNQSKLAALVLRQEYVTSLTEFTEPDAAEGSKKPRAEFESLCCYVRCEIDQKLESLRVQLSKEVLQTLEAPRPGDFAIGAEQLSAVQHELHDSFKAGHASNEAQLTRLFRITQEQASLLDEVRQRVARPSSMEEAGPDDGGMQTRSLLPSNATGDASCQHGTGSPLDATLGRDARYYGQLDFSGSSGAVVAPIVLQSRAVQERPVATLQLPVVRQQAALKQVMDDELRRARSALEGMPTFGVADRLSTNSQGDSSLEAWEVPDTCAPGDIDSIPLSGRWFAAPAAPVPPGLRAQASEEIIAAAPLASADAALASPPAAPNTPAPATALPAAAGTSPSPTAAPPKATGVAPASTAAAALGPTGQSPPAAPPAETLAAASTQ